MSDDMIIENDVKICGTCVYGDTKCPVYARCDDYSLWEKASNVLRFLPYDGCHSVEEKMPEPHIMLIIDCAENNDSVGGGAATLGVDGKWYWTYDYKIYKECKYPVIRWQYMDN